MPSNAFVTHLKQLLLDAEELEETHARLRTGNPGRQFGLASLNRAAVVMSISAWESYVEEVVKEAVQVLRPPGISTSVHWPALHGSVLNQIGRFHTPNPANVQRLVEECLGLPQITAFWVWQNTTSNQASQRLTEALNYRHQIAHGVNPRPNILNQYSSRLPNFIRKLARATDEAIRNHLIKAHGIATPWPA